MSQVIEISDLESDNLILQEAEKIVDLSSDTFNLGQVHKRRSEEKFEIIVNDESSVPSSPNLEIYATIGESLNDSRISNSMEISVPFLDDRTNDKVAFADMSSQTQGNGSLDSLLKKKSSPSPKGKRLLDDIISYDLSRESNDFETTIDDLEKKKSNIRILAKAWRKASRKVGAHVPSSIEMFPKIRQNDDPTQVSNRIDLNGHDPQLPSQNIFDEFPLLSSIPVKTSEVQETPDDILPDGQLVNENPSEESLSFIRDEGDISAVRNDYRGNRKEKSNKRLVNAEPISEEIVHSIELNVPNFLEDNSCNFGSNFESTPNKKKRKRTLIVEESTASKTGLVLPVRRSSLFMNLEKDSQTEKLSQYIVNSKHYDENESKRMLQNCLRNKKKIFKQVNQIYRDNQKARVDIIMETTKKILDTFEKSMLNFKELISPAIVQTAYNNTLPLIRFFRKCYSIYDLSHDYYYPEEMKIIEENICIFYFDAQEFFGKYCEDKKGLYKSIREYSKRGKYVILVLNGLTEFKRAIDTLEDNNYKAKVQERLSGHSPTKKVHKRLEHIKDMGIKKFDLEQRLRYIDREWNVKVHTVNSHLEFITSLPNLISLLGKQRMDPAIRFMKYAHINVRSGKNKEDILKKTLHETSKMPELKARGVVSIYPTFQELLADFEKGQLRSGLDGKHLLTEAMEKRLYIMLTSNNPDDVVP